MTDAHNQPPSEEISDDLKQFLQDRGVNTGDSEVMKAVSIVLDYLRTKAEDAGPIGDAVTQSLDKLIADLENLRDAEKMIIKGPSEKITPSSYVSEVILKFSDSFLTTLSRTLGSSLVVGAGALAFLSVTSEIPFVAELFHKVMALIQHLFVSPAHSQAMLQTGSNMNSTTTGAPFLIYVVYTLFSIAYIFSLFGAFLSTKNTRRQANAFEAFKTLTAFFIGAATGKSV